MYSISFNFAFSYPFYSLFTPFFITPTPFLGWVQIYSADILCLPDGLESCQRVVGLDQGGQVQIRLESSSFSELFSLLATRGPSYQPLLPHRGRLIVNNCQLKDVQVVTVLIFCTA
jgi:hypothetical protein